jgi:hypothetical protein
MGESVAVWCFGHTPFQRSDQRTRVVSNQRKGEVRIRRGIREYQFHFVIWRMLVTFLTWPSSGAKTSDDERRKKRP